MIDEAKRKLKWAESHLNSFSPPDHPTYMGVSLEEVSQIQDQAKRRMVEQTLDPKPFIPFLEFLRECGVQIAFQDEYPMLTLPSPKNHN